jgi:hypothetical protein
MSDPSTNQTKPVESQPSQDVNSKHKLREKLEELRSRRTGEQRRKYVAEMKKETQEKQPKNAMKHIMKDSIRQLLSKFGITDPKIENEIIREIAMGHLKTHTQIAEAITRKLQVLVPNSAPKSQRKPTTDATVNTPATTSTTTSITPTTPTLNTNEQQNQSTLRKPLKHPSKDLLKSGIHTKNET